MAANPEKQKPKRIERLHFRVEEDVAFESEEFLNQFLGLLIENNLDPQQLVFSGMEGAPFKKNKKMAPVKGVYAMNLTGWQATFIDAIHMYSPPVFAEKKHVPAIGLFDKKQLREVYGHQIEDHPPNLLETEQDLGKISLGGESVFGWGEPVYGGSDALDDEVKETDKEFLVIAPQPEFREEPEDFTDVELGEPLVDLPPSAPVFEGVVHINYPNVPISEALVGIVYVEKIPIKHGGPRNRAGL